MVTLINVLYDMTTILLVPVVLVLLVLLCLALFETGGFLREWAERRRRDGAWRAACGEYRSRTSDPEASRSDFFGRTEYPSLVAAFSRRGNPHRDDRETLERLITRIEMEAAERLARMNLWIRIGPMVGLMGTLIPMGPALIGLTSRNLDTLAQNLVVAFSTTVVGLTVGVLYSIMAAARRQWYLRDVADLDDLLDSAFFRGSPGLAVGGPPGRWEEGGSHG